MCDKTSISLGIPGYIITLVINYFIAWTVPWFLIFSGLYLLGIALAWAWGKWTGYEAYYSPVAIFFSFVIGVFLIFPRNAWTILTGNWCPIGPCVPLFWPLAVLILGSLVYSGIEFLNKPAKNT